MRPAPRAALAAALLALLALPLGGAQAPAAAPNLAIVAQPEYTVGDFWQYRVVFIVPGTGGNGSAAETFPQDQTVRVLGTEDFQGTRAYRMFTESVQDIPGDAQSGDVHATSNKTTWVATRGHGILRIEETVDRTQATAQFRILTHREVNWTFHEPMDLYQFPIVKDDAWVVLTNATVESNTTIRTHVAGNEPREVPPRYESGNVTQASTTSWVRQDRVNLTGRTYDGVVLVSRSGNATIRDFWSPQVGNLVRREILNESGALVETSTLVAYRYAKAPAAGPPGGGPSAAGAPWVPLAGAAVVGVVVALGALAVARRIRRPGDEAPPAPAEPAPAAGATGDPGAESGGPEEPAGSPDSGDGGDGGDGGETGERR